VAPTKAEHGELAGEIGRLIGNFVHAHKLGKVYGAETGFLMEQDPPQVRAADIAFLSRERAQAVRRKQWLPFPPDLAVEIVSEYERAADLRRKARSYLANGTRLLWLIYPDEREIEVHRPGQPLQTLGVEDTLEGGDVLPGFRATVREIFAVLDEMVDSEAGP
jgi:Uma2 family endonuclease